MGSALWGTLRGPESLGWVRQEGLKLWKLLDVPMAACAAQGPSEGLAHSHRDQSHPQAHPGRTSDRGVTLPARHAGPCPLPPSLPLLSLKNIRFAPYLSVIRQLLLVSFFLFFLKGNT